MPKKKLTIKEQKIVKGVVEGKTQVQAYKDAGYSTNTNDNVIRTAANQIVNKPHIQLAINEALYNQGLTPEWAVEQLGKVARQDDEIGAKRLAAKDILELHGWNKSERPTIQLDIKSAFFNGGRNIESRPPEE